MHMKERALIIKFGGSVATTPDGANKDYLRSFLKGLGLDLLRSYQRVGLVIGGGSRVRALQKGLETDYQKDMIAQGALWEHAQDLLSVAGEVGLETVDRIPHSRTEAYQMVAHQQKPVLAMSWVTTGQSTDAAAVMLSEMWQQRQYKAEIVILSNVFHILTGDPKQDITARPIRSSSVERLVEEGVLIDNPDDYKSGMNVTIDPVAVRNLLVMNEQIPSLFFGHANDIASVIAYLLGKIPENGTVLKPTNLSTVYANA